MMNPIRKKGRGGGSGKALAPHPDELIGVSPTSDETHKSLPGLKTRKPVESINRSPLEATGGSYGSSNLAAAVLRSFQREKEERRSLPNAAARGDDSTPKVVEVGDGAGGKALPEVPQKKVVRSVSRGKDSGKPKEEKPAPKSRDSSDEKRGSRRSVSAQPVRECRHREPFDCSSKVSPGLGLQVQRGVAKAFLRSSTSSASSSSSARVGESRKSSGSRIQKQEESEELKEVVELVTPRGEAAGVKPGDEGLHPSAALHQRLALLEEKVVQLASELRETKEALHASNPLSNQILSDIQLKISGIEALVSRAACQPEDASKPHGTNPTLSYRAVYRQEDPDKPRDALASHAPCRQEQPEEISKLQASVVDEKFLSQLRDKPALHKKLLESRAALQQKIVENRMLLRNKIAALDGAAEPGMEGEVITAEFLASLKQTQTLAMANGRSTDMELGSSLASSGVPAKFMDMENLPLCGINRSSPVVMVPGDVNPRVSDELGPLRTSGSYKTANTSGSGIVSESLENLACEEALEDDEEEEGEGISKENFAPADDSIGDEPEPELCELGTKAAMAGWFVYEAEGLLLAHEDGSCAFYDSANMEEKSRYKSPLGLSPATWQDCWLIRAAGPDGRACKYVVAASAGTAVDPAFCSWNFYEKTIAAYHSESPPTPGSAHSGGSDEEAVDFPLWWYRPCGSLMASAGSGMSSVSLYDVRDGEPVMRWSSPRCLATTMGYNSPLHWRSKSSLLVAENEGITIWDVSNPGAQCLNNVGLPGKVIQAIHIYNSDGECSGGVRQRNSCNDSGGIDGVLATQDSVNTLDVRVPSGIGLQFPALGRGFHSIFSQGDSIFAGFTGPNNECGVQQWSIRQGQPVRLFTIPYSASSHQLQSEVLQVWGDSSHVMAVNGNGLFMFDAASGSPRAVIGSDDLYCPSFDYSGSKVLLVSRDRPASWQYWPLTHPWTL